MRNREQQPDRRHNSRYRPFSFRSLLYGAVVVLLLAAVLLLTEQSLSYRQGREYYRTLAAAVVTEDTAGVPQVDFAALSAQNPQVKGWLLSEDGAISYPVVQGNDNRYYRTHLFDGRENEAGCLFLDAKAQGFGGQNTVIYGQNSRDGSMFAVLWRYASPEYFQEHPQMWLLTPEGTYTVHLFAVFTTDPSEQGNSADPWQQTYADADAYSLWLQEMRQRSLVEAAFVPCAEMRILTLSTSYEKGKPCCVVMGTLQPLTEDGNG